MRCLSILVTLFCLCINANADTKSEKVAELVEAKGLLDGWAAQIERNQEYFGVQEQTIVDQTLSRLNPNEEFQQRFSSAIREFQEAAAAPWTAEYMVECNVCVLVVFSLVVKMFKNHSLSIK